MTFEVLEQYLDGELNAEQRVAVERTAQSDPRVAAMLAQARTAREARAASLKAYEPTPDEAHTLATRILVQCANEPAIVGRVGNFGALKRIAAAIAIVALIGGAFGVGRLSAPVKTVEVVKQEKVIEYVPGETKTIHRVVYMNNSGTTQTKEFADAAEATAYIQELQQRYDTSTMVANLDRPGAF